MENIQFVTGLRITQFSDCHGRLTEVYRGYNEVIMVHKEPDGDTLRRYTVP